MYLDTYELNEPLWTTHKQCWIPIMYQKITGYLSLISLNSLSVNVTVYHSSERSYIPM